MYPSCIAVLLTDSSFLYFINIKSGILYHPLVWCFSGIYYDYFLL